jgi:hypothetical protein
MSSFDKLLTRDSTIGDAMGENAPTLRGRRFCFDAAGGGAEVRRARIDASRAACAADVRNVSLIVLGSRRASSRDELLVVWLIGVLNVVVSKRVPGMEDALTFFVQRVVWCRRFFCVFGCLKDQAATLDAICI